MDVLRVASEEGTIGLVALLVLLVAIGIAIAGALRAAGPDRPLVWAMAAGIVVIMLASQTEGRFYLDPYLWLLIGLLAGAWRTAPTTEAAVHQGGPKDGPKLDPLPAASAGGPG
jgi:O-antigen ligase